MSYQRDYLLRLIEQCTSVVAQLMGMKQQQKYKEAAEAVDTAFGRYFGLSSKLVNSLSHQELLDLLKTNELMDIEKIVGIAVLLKEEGKLWELQEDEHASYRSYLKSFHLFSEAYFHEWDSDVVSPESELQLLIDKLKPYQLPEDINERLFRVYEQMGRYADAEDVLYDLIEQKEYDESFREQATLFYERLLTKPEAELTSGNLPIDEIHEAIENLQTMPWREK